MVLLIAESMAVRNAVLSQSPEFKEARLSAYHDATTVYDLLTVATVRWGQVALLQEVRIYTNSSVISVFHIHFILLPTFK